MNKHKFNKLSKIKNTLWLIPSALIFLSMIEARAEIKPLQNNSYNQLLQISQNSTNFTQVETEVLEFINAWGEAWSPKENATEFTRASIEPFYLQSEELLGFDFTDAESQTVFKGVQVHHNTWEAFVRGYDYWTFTPVTESIRVYHQSDNAAAVTLYNLSFEQGKKYIYDGLQSGKLNPIIDPQSFSLENIVEAHRYMESNQQNGKIIVTV